MLETTLVYIYSAGSDFIGCGALVEGGYIATCRHVWRDAIDSDGVGASEPPQAEIKFPFVKGQGGSCHARLADDCDGSGEDEIGRAHV